MSEILEREGDTSTLVSALGAWLGLGAGLALLTICLLSLTNFLYLPAGAESPSSVLREQIGPDLASTKAKVVSIANGGQTLELLSNLGPEGTLAPVLYSVDQLSNVLIRSTTGGERELPLGVYPSLNFSLKDGILTASWREQGAQKRESWAIHR